MMSIKSTAACLALALILLSNVNNSYQQFWRNDKIVKQWEQIAPSVGGSSPQAIEDIKVVKSEYSSNTQSAEQQPQQQQQQQQQGEQMVEAKKSDTEKVARQFNAAFAPSYPGIQVLPAAVPAPAPLSIIPGYIAAPAPAAVPVGPYAIQQQGISNTGEIIIENLVGGIPFDCTGKISGHYRDTKYCDIFHACVWGSQRKTYACPIVGERTYFSEATRRCEFASQASGGCLGNAYYH